MRCCAFLLLVLTVLASCSKNNTVRTNFAEVTVGGQKIVFNSLEAVFDTSTQGITCKFEVSDRASNSYISWEILSGSKWINGIYKHPGELFPSRSLVYLHLQTYINGVPGTYTPGSNPLIVTIDQSENGRIHGTLSGKMICYTCIPYGEEVSITNGEFEMPYSYR